MTPGFTKDNPFRG